MGSRSYDNTTRIDKHKRGAHVVTANCCDSTQRVNHCLTSVADTSNPTRNRIGKIKKGQRHQGVGYCDTQLPGNNYAHNQLGQS